MLPYKISVHIHDQPVYRAGCRCVSFGGTHVVGDTLRAHLVALCEQLCLCGGTLLRGRSLRNPAEMSR